MNPADMIAEITRDLAQKAVTPREQTLVRTVGALGHGVLQFCQLHATDREFARNVLAAWDRFVEAPTGSDEARELFVAFRDAITALRVASEHSQATRQQIGDQLLQQAALLDLNVL